MTLAADMDAGIDRAILPNGVRETLSVASELVVSRSGDAARLDATVSLKDGAFSQR